MTPDERLRAAKEALIPGTDLYVPFPVVGWNFDAFQKHPEGVFEHAKALAQDFFLAEGLLPLMGLLYARRRLTRDPSDNNDDIVWACTLRKVHPLSKNQLSRYVRGLVAPMQIQAVCWVSEMWTPKNPMLPGSEEERSLRAWNAKHGTYEGWPGIVEKLFTQVETRQRMYQAFADIRRDKKGKPSLAPWVDPGAVVHGGHLSGMFHDLTTVGA